MCMFISLLYCGSYHFCDVSDVHKCSYYLLLALLPVDENCKAESPHDLASGISYPLVWLIATFVVHIYSTNEPT